MNKNNGASEFAAGLWEMSADKKRAEMGATAHTTGNDLEQDPPKEYIAYLKRCGFILGELLGRGATGGVFKGHQPNLDRPVAVKFCDSPEAKPGSQNHKRFLREAKLLAKVESPHLPFVLTRGKVDGDGVPFYVMQFLPGRDLSERLAGGRRIEPEEAVVYMRHVLTGLAAAHRAGVMHRDVRPANVRISEGRACLLDFSIGGHTTSSHTKVTEVGDRVGMYDYLAPEQKVGAIETDARTDVHQAGRLFFHMLSSRAEVRIDTLEKDLPAIRPGLLALIRKACADAPADRFQDAGEFLESLPREMPGNFRLRSGPCVCPSPRCPGANWDHDDRYQGPRELENSEDEYCGLCQTKLVYECPRCGKVVGAEPFCGRCKTELFSLPRCRSCASPLRLEDFDRDTENDGCSACNPPEEVPEDIPF